MNYVNKCCSLLQHRLNIIKVARKDVINKMIGKRLKYLRSKENKTQKEVADDLKTATHLINRMYRACLDGLSAEKCFLLTHHPD